MSPLPAETYRMSNHARTTAFAAIGCALTLALAGLLAACGNDGDDGADGARIETQNTAAAGAEGTRIDGGRRSVFDIRPGDCLQDGEPGNAYDRLHVVPCDSDDATAVVVSMFAVDPAPDEYPGTPFFDDLAGRHCGRDATSFLKPTSDSWEAGDRTVKCVQNF
jgi:hypothetical protein